MQKPDMRNISSILPLINPNPNAIRGTLPMMKQYNTHGSKQSLIACYVLFYVFLNWDLWIDDYVVHKGDSQNITY